MSKIFVLHVAVFLAAFGAAQAQDTQIGGFVDGAYYINTVDDNGEFGLDQVELDITHSASDKTLLRADVEWVKDGEDYTIQAEQGYMTYTANCGWAFTLGKFNAPIGFELLDAPDMYQYSHALVFDHGLPTNLTGINLAKDFGQGLDLIAHVSNGWDRATADDNVTYGGRLGYSKDRISGGISAISGKEDMPDESSAKADRETITRTVIDIDVAYQMERLLFGGEFNSGAVDYTGGGEAKWMGILFMVNAAISDRFGVTFRYDLFDDQDGFVFGAIGDEMQKRQAITIAPSVNLDDGFVALVEFRVDMSDQDAFIDSDGEPTDSSTAVAFEMTYSW